MNIATPLIPVAAAAVDTVVRGVVDVVQAGSDFARMLQSPDRVPGGGGKGSFAVDVDWGPEATNWGEVVRRDALRQSFESLRKEVHQQLMQKFAERGIDVSEPIVLAADSFDRLLETGNHLDRGAIEELLQNDPALSRQVRQLLDRGSVLWESGPTRADGGQPRLVVGEKELFFQVV